jgi:lipid II isoglutaminyl synthase (glutamine-hydrolysing)
MRPAMAVGLARITAGLVGIADHQGTALPGMVAERVWPEAFATLASRLGATVLVIGTNGKTTTAGLIAQIFRRPDGPPIANRSGANLRQGLVTSLVLASDLHGRIVQDVDRPRDAVFEVDELAFEGILPELGPAVIVATNLFRDQLDRYGEADAVVDRWARALTTAADGSILVYCADDPRLAMLASGSHLPSRSFGLAGMPSDRRQHHDAGDMTADPMACWRCGRQLTYAWRSIGHLGAFACPADHIRRATPDVAIELAPDLTAAQHQSAVGSDPFLRLSGPLGGADARPCLIGLPNAYNVAAAVAAGTIVGHTVEQSATAIAGYAGVFGRLEWLTIRERRVVFVLIKNTVSLAETVHLGPSLAADVVLLGLNDAPADGRDVSWIWDAPIAVLVARRAVVLTGSRSADLQLRLRYVRGDCVSSPTSIDERASMSDALDLAISLAPRGGVVVVAATYTALMGMRAIAHRRGYAPAPPR